VQMRYRQTRLTATLDHDGKIAASHWTWEIAADTEPRGALCGTIRRLTRSVWASALPARQAGKI
jgi:hypothetical protein